MYSLGLTRPVLEPTNYRIRGEHATNYTTDAVDCEKKKKIRMNRVGNVSLTAGHQRPIKYVDN